MPSEQDGDCPLPGIERIDLLQVELALLLLNDLHVPVWLNKRFSALVGVDAPQGLARCGWWQELVELMVCGNRTEGVWALTPPARTEVVAFSWFPVPNWQGQGLCLLPLAGPIALADERSFRAVCSVCSLVRLTDGSWVPRAAAPPHRGADTHGYCPRCACDMLDQFHARRERNTDPPPAPV